MLNEINSDIIANCIYNKKYDIITECISIIHPNESQVKLHKYPGKQIRVMPVNNKIDILIPTNITCLQESNLISSIKNGEIFNDAKNIDNNAKYIVMKTLPLTAIKNKHDYMPKKITFAVTGVIGIMNDCGKCECNDTDIKNGMNYVHDITTSNSNVDDISDINEKYIYGKHICDDDIDSQLRSEIESIKNDMMNINDVDADDEITDADFDAIKLDEDVNNDGVEDYEESFFSKKPKKLKPIPRDIISYITIELNDIQDVNDQAMLSGYTCSKLELVDFYLNCIDTQDDRYIVPHTKSYLTQMQGELNKLLAAILKVKPINRNDRVWRVNVNYPDGWRG